MTGARGALRRGTLLVAVAALMAAGFATSTTSSVAAKPTGKGDIAKARFFSFNDFHGALDAPGGSGAAVNGIPAGGAEYLATHAEEAARGRRGQRPEDADRRRRRHGRRHAAAQRRLPRRAHHRDAQPAARWTSPRSATTSSTRASTSCCGCRTAAATRPTAARTATRTSAPTSPTSPRTPSTRTPARRSCRRGRSRKVQGVRVGFIGMTLEGTPRIVNPAGITDRRLPRRGRDGQQVRRGAAGQGRRGDRAAASTRAAQQNAPPTPIDPSGCANFSGPLVNIVAGLDPEFDLVVSGHTHRPYVCSLPDSAGRADPGHQRRQQRPDRHRHHGDAEQAVRRLHQPQREERDRRERHQEP